MSSATRRKEQRHAKVDAFCWLPCDALLVAACTLSAPALAVLLAMNANWKPLNGFTPKGRSEGRTRLADRLAKALLRIGKATLDAARAELLAAAWIVEVSPATRPGGQGGALGLAAVFDIPIRHRGERPALPMPPNVRRPSGHVRWNVHRLRDDLRHLRGPALRVAVYALALGDRTQDGALAAPGPVLLPVDEVAARLRLPRSTAADAIAEAVASGFLIQTRRGTGRAPALFELAPHHRAWERIAPPGLRPSAMVSPSGPVAGHYAGRNGESGLPGGHYGAGKPLPRG